MVTRRILRLIAALLLALTLTGGHALATAPAAEAAPKRYAAVCSQTTWTGKDPRTCKGTYTVYEITANRPKTVLHLTRGTKVDWKTFKKGYKAANKWCDDNTIVCQVMLAVGVSVALGWMGPAKS